MTFSHRYVSLFLLVLSPGVIAATPWPIGFVSIDAVTETAIEPNNLVVFPGFVVITVVQNWKTEQATGSRFSAMHVAFPCRGDIKVINSSFSDTNFQDAIYRLKTSTPVNVIWKIDLPGLVSNNVARHAAKLSCKVRSTNQRSSIEVPITSTNHSVISVLPQSLVISGNARSAWLLSRATTQEPMRLSDGSPMKLPDGSNYSRPIVDSTGPTKRSFIAIDCRNHTLTMKDVVSYGKDGRVEMRIAVSPGVAPSAVAPGTIGEEVSDFLCSL
jgi:hypothetical protein